MSMFLGSIVFLLILVSFTFGIRSFIDDEAYNPTLSDSMNETLNEFDSVFDDVNTEVITIRNTTEGVEATQVVETGINPGRIVSATKLLYRLPAISMSLLGNLAIKLGVPQFFLTAFISVFIVAIIIIIATIATRIVP